MKIENLTTPQKTVIALKLKSTASFFRQYFEYLPKFETQKACFIFLNDIYFDVYGEDKYSGFQSFRNVMYRDRDNYLKTKKND
jgi:hypothetical protein